MTSTRLPTLKQVDEEEQRCISPHSLGHQLPQQVYQIHNCVYMLGIQQYLHLKEGDEGKAVFPTHKGLFEPMVMFFRLTNSPVTFQMMMNTIF